MPRRETKNVTNIKGTGQADYTVVWRVLECGRAGCDHLFKVSEDAPAFRQTGLTCPKCKHKNKPALIQRGARWKYCRVCEWLQPLENFHRHKSDRGSFRSGHQLECRACKNTLINPFLNPKRTSDQHRESTERRRLYELLAGEEKLDSETIFRRFSGRCFRCGKPLHRTGKGRKEYQLDHTLPARLLWPLVKGPTVLCKDCNNAKHEKWPAEVYSKPKLRELSVLTGIPYELLSGKPCLNPEAVKKLRANIDAFLRRWIKYPNEIKKVRKLVLDFEGVDIFEEAQAVPNFLLESA